LTLSITTGCAVAWDGNFKAQTEGDLFSAVIDLLLNCAAFIYIGAWLPFASYDMPELGIVPYRLILLFLCILVLRRIPALLLLYPWVPEIRDWKEALFSGHFGKNYPDRPSFLAFLRQ
jgi:NhaP-type Na+/H+ or K+/H+ antiporter